MQTDAYTYGECFCVYVCVQRIFQLSYKSGSFQDITDKKAICLIRQRTHAHIHMYVCICISKTISTFSASIIHA